MITEQRAKVMLAKILEHMARGDSDLRLVGQDDQPLGTLNNDATSPESLLNANGPHGGTYGPESVLNPYSQYGSQYGLLSMRNPYSIAPPKLMLDGSVLCVISANPGMINGIDPDDFVFVVKNKKLP